MVAYVACVAALLAHAAFRIVRQPGSLRRSSYWGQIAVVAMALSAIAPLIAGARSFSIFGVAQEAPAEAYQIANALWLFAVVAGVIAIALGKRGSGNGFALGALYGLGVALALGSAVGAPTASLAVGGLALALVCHAAWLSYVERPEETLGRLRLIARGIVAISLVGALVAPGWAFMPGTARLLPVDRLTGVMQHPNALAVVACVALALELVRPRARWYRLFFGLSASALLLTQSTTGLLLLLVIPLVVLLGTKPSWRVPVIFSVATAGAIAALTLNVTTILFDTFGVERLASFSGRTDIWDYAWGVIAENPWFGQGTFFLSEQDRLLHLGAGLQQASNAHNQLVQTLGEGGLIGGLSLGVLFLATAWTAWSQRSIDGYGRVALWLAVWVSALTEVPLRPLGPSQLAAMIALPLLLGPRPRRQAEPEAARRDESIANNSAPSEATPEVPSGANRS